MEAILSPQKTKTTQKINLIDGYFTPTEAQDVLMALLDEKINFHKIKRLSITEGNIESECHYDNTRIDQLIKEKQIAKDFFDQVRASGAQFEINSTIEIKVKQ